MFQDPRTQGNVNKSRFCVGLLNRYIIKKKLTNKTFMIILVPIKSKALCKSTSEGSKYILKG